jgi:signal transduction histidine kinase
MPSTEAEPRPVFRVMSRRSEGRVLGGVAGGLADHLGVRVAWVRAVFLVLVLCQGAGLFCYAALWLLRPLDQEHPEHARGSGLPNQRARAVDWALILAALAGLALLNSAHGVSWVSLIAVAIGAALLWRALDGAVKRKHGSSSWCTPAGWIWVVAGVGIVIAGLAVVLVAQIDLSALRAAFAAVAVTLVGVGLILLPVLAKLWRSLDAERAAHAREEERARLAAHLHDSALQTLTLIQKQAENPREVIRLARGGERELRQWLFEPLPEAGEGLHEALRKIVAHVEDDHRVRVGAVFVGEPNPGFCAERAEALVGATREALVNAAKHSGALDIALYVESDVEGSAVYVRDRGAGFDPLAVDTDRRGVAVSIIDRTRRQRGRAEVRSEIGGGTEVRLWVPA